VKGSARVMATGASAERGAEAETILPYLRSKRLINAGLRRLKLRVASAWAQRGRLVEPVRQKWDSALGTNGKDVSRGKALNDIGPRLKRGNEEAMCRCREVAVRCAVAHHLA
jgi:hypothetical protein